MCGVEAHVLPQADGPLPLASGGNVGRATRVFQDACHISAVHDAELGFQPHYAAILSQHAHTQGVEGANQHIVGGFANQTFGALTHFGGGFVGKGDGGNALGLKPRLDEAANLVRDDARLARARTRQHQTRTVQEIDGFLLREIQTSRHSGDSDCEAVNDTDLPTRQNRYVLNILLVTFPFFALVLAGFVAAHRRMLPLDAIPGLNGFVLFFALPCMLYRFGASTPIVQLLDATLFFAYLLCALLMVCFVVAVSLNKRIGWNDASFGALVGAFPNTGFMGVPLLVALLGASAAGPAIVTIVVDMVITTSLCIALSRLDGADEHGASKAAMSALKGVLTNPMPWAISLGALSSAMDYELIGPFAKTVGLLADAASPVALFTIGAVLARSQIRVKESGHPPILWRDFLPVAIFKLVLHPVLVLLVMASAVQMGFVIERFTMVVVVLVAALPSASNVALLTERFGADTGRIAMIILFTTAAAFFTFSGAVALLHG